MMHVFRRTWADVIQPLWYRSRRAQVAALCYRETASGKEVLLITSRDTGRWIVPKGWPIEGLDGPESALQEAWEEAGVARANIRSKPFGYFAYEKGMSDGPAIPIRTTVYLTEVETLKGEYPEADERTRQWFAPQEAANLVAEPELQDILRRL